MERRFPHLKTFLIFLLLIVMGFTLLLLIRENRIQRHFTQQAAGSCTHTFTGSSISGGYKPGDVICLPAGSRGRLNISGLQGSATSPITIQNTGGVVRINGDPGIMITNSRYVHITGTGSSDQYGIDITGGHGLHAADGTHYTEIDHLKVHDTSNTAFAIRFQNPGTQLGMHIHHNYLVNINGNEGMYIGHANNNNAGGPVLLKDLEVDHNITEKTGREGIEVKSCVENCRVHHNKVIDAGLSRLASQDKSLNLSVISANVVVYNNMVIGGTSVGLNFVGAGPYEAYNNVVINPGGEALNWANGSGKMYNNTFINGAIKTNGTFYNNIIANGSGGSGTSNITGATGSLGFVNPGSNDFHLTANSSAVDAAASPFPTFDFDDKPRPQGAKADIGAFEFGGSAPSIPPTIIPTNPTVPPVSTGPTTPPVSGTTSLSLTLLLHGIGKGGDNVNPTALGTMNPGRPQRTVSLEITDTNSQTVTKQGTVTYNSTVGNFQGTIPAGTLQTGSYIVKVGSPQYLTKTVPGIVSFTSGQTKIIPAIALTTGDTTLDNRLNILDYNVILDCYADIGLPKNCSDTTKKQNADITDDSFVNQFDYNLFLRELSVQSGQ